MPPHVQEEHTLIVFTDPGRDPDDCAMAQMLQRYGSTPRNVFSKIVFVCVGGDRPTQNAHILAKVLNASEGGTFMSLDELYIVIGSPTRGGHEFEYGADWIGPFQKMKQLDEPITGTISVLIAAPLAGITLIDFIDLEHSFIHSCVYVGNKPEPGNLGVNGGSSLTSELDRIEIMANLCIFESMSNGNMVYLPPNFTRTLPITLKNLKLYNNAVLTQLYVDITSKYLLKERPVHLHPQIQVRVASANMQSLMSICEQWPSDSVCPNEAINDPAFTKLGLAYSLRTDFGKDRNMSIMDISNIDEEGKMKMRAELAEKTAKVITCQAYINTLGFTAEAAETPEKGLARYMENLGDDKDMPLMPFYDGIGAAVITILSREANTNGLVFKTFSNAFAKNKCGENERYPMTMAQHIVHMEINKV